MTATHHADSNHANRSLAPIGLDAAKLLDGFWLERAKTVRRKIIAYQWEAINDRIPGIAKSHAVQNFRIAAGEAEGRFYGRPFQDSDVYKWLEAVAYALNGEREPELEALADGVIDLIAKAQQPDGYLHTYYIIEALDRRWTNVRDDHELYVAGHLIEAATAYAHATGKTKFLDVARKLADHIDTVFGDGEGKLRGYPGHAEIELALVKLYRCTGEKRYLRLCKYFVDERGQSPNFFDKEAQARGDKEPYGPWMGLYTNEYNQSHQPVREQDVAVGHAVRAVYLYCAMADLAKELSDDDLLETCRRLWRNVTSKQMYVTGAIGSSAHGEAFTFDYDLPNDAAYNETCASIGLVMWAHRMLHAELDGKYADTIEQALYNGILSGMSLEGTKYFYVNPLEVWPQACDCRHDRRHVKSTRQEWFGSACCPPNIARLFASLSQYVYSRSDSTFYAHLYVNSSADVEFQNRRVTVTQRSDYPWNGTIRIGVEAEDPNEFDLAVRIPGWCKQYQLKVNGQDAEQVEVIRGYAHIRREWRGGDEVELVLDMPVDRIRANPRLRAAAGKVALRRGPVVFCLEEADNGPVLPDITLPKNESLEAEFVRDELGGVVVIHGVGRRTVDAGGDGVALYIDRALERESFPLRAVPYYTWNNRGRGEMQVWIREE